MIIINYNYDYEYYNDYDDDLIPDSSPPKPGLWGWKWKMLFHYMVHLILLYAVCYSYL